MLRGTRILDGSAAKAFHGAEVTITDFLSDYGLERVIVPAIWEADTFLDKVGDENANMMWRFKDKGDREVCLIPEVTGLIQETWRDVWSKSTESKSLFYVSRCYRYERPQKGRYREFTQIGVEFLGKHDPLEVELLMKEVLHLFSDRFTFTENVKRGLSYYTCGGFEAAAPWLGAQKQVAGGGTYEQGTGFAIGLDRLVLAMEDIR